MTDQTETGLPRTGTCMTADTFFDLPETTRPIQLLAGEIIVSPPPVPKHQMTVGNAYLLLRGGVPNGKVFMAPIALYLDDANVPEPEVAWIAAGSRCVIADKRLEGPPELIIEVLSPSTARYDKTVKFLLYEKYGVGEYWLIDPDAEQVEVWVLEQGEYVRQGLFAPGQAFQSTALGMAMIDVQVIFDH